jgi:hypothetical protein
MDSSSFHQFIQRSLPEKSFEYVFLLLLGLLIYFILDRYFRVRPKISAEIKIGPNGDWSSGSSRIPGEIEMEWRRQLILKSITKHDSIDIQLIWPDNNNRLDIRMPEHTIVRGYDKYEVSFAVKKSFPHDQVVAAGSSRETLLPPELKEVRFVIAYSSEKGKKFYTLFKFNSRTGHENFFYRVRPRI